MSAPSHVSVMRSEVLAVLSPRPGQVAIDGTIGLAGHSSAIAEMISPGGLLLGFDKDADMLRVAEARLQGVQGVEIRLFNSDFREAPERLAEVCRELGRPARADAILLDLGLNNAQIEDPSRGFSFREEGPLDMRMDRSSGESAASALNRLSAAEIESILIRYADERWARKIAAVIVERRRKDPLKTTQDLVDCVLAAIPAAKREKRIHPATRTFQGLRIYVNRELDDLEDAVRQLAACLAPKGTLVVLSYHSGEDREVKHAFRALSASGEYTDLFRKPQGPNPFEVETNPKSRSAKMRAITRGEAA